MLEDGQIEWVFCIQVRRQTKDERCSPSSTAQDDDMNNASARAWYCLVDGGRYPPFESSSGGTSRRLCSCLASFRSSNAVRGSFIGDCFASEGDDERKFKAFSYMKNIWLFQRLLSRRTSIERQYPGISDINLISLCWTG